MDQNSERRRGHFRRGRRGPDRRGSERRAAPAPGQEAPARDRVDVEQIMRDIRARIGKRDGIALSDDQIQDLAARRLESILDPRTMDASLLDQLRRGAVAPAEPPSPESDLSYSFEDTTIYESHRGVLRFIRRLLNPLLKLFFNPNPLIRALNLQARINAESQKRDAVRDERQAEWNALHYEILQRLVTEVSRASLELQSLSLRLESLSAKVDFNERRVRGIEGVMQRRPAPEPAQTAGAPTDAAAPETVADGQSGEAGRRRRRRRRGRRGAGGPGDLAAAGGSVMSSPDAPATEPPDTGSAEPSAAPEPSGAPMTTEGATLVAREEEHPVAPTEAVPAEPTPAAPREEPAGPADRPERPLAVPDSGSEER